MALSNGRACGFLGRCSYMRISAAVGVVSNVVLDLDFLDFFEVFVFFPFGEASDSSSSALYSSSSSLDLLVFLGIFPKEKLITKIVCHLLLSSFSICLMFLVGLPSASKHDKSTL